MVNFKRISWELGVPELSRLFSRLGDYTPPVSSSRDQVVIFGGESDLEELRRQFPAGLNLEGRLAERIKNNLSRLKDT